MAPQILSQEQEYTLNALLFRRRGVPCGDLELTGEVMDYKGKMEVIEDAGENFSFRLAGKEFVARGGDVLHTLRGLIGEAITLTVPPCDDVEADRFANSEAFRFIESIKRAGHGRYEIDLGS